MTWLSDGFLFFVHIVPAAQQKICQNFPSFPIRLITVIASTYYALREDPRLQAAGELAFGTKSEPSVEHVATPVSREKAVWWDAAARYSSCLVA